MGDALDEELAKAEADYLAKLDKGRLCVSKQLQCSDFEYDTASVEKNNK